MTQQEAADMLGDILDGLYLGTDPRIRNILYPLPEDRTMPEDASGFQMPVDASYPQMLNFGEDQWHAREVIFKGVLPKNFVPSGNNTYFSAFGPTPWYTGISEDACDSDDKTACSPCASPEKLQG